MDWLKAGLVRRLIAGWRGRLGPARAATGARPTGASETGARETNENPYKRRCRPAPAIMDRAAKRGKGRMAAEGRRLFCFPGNIRPRQATDAGRGLHPCRPATGVRLKTSRSVKSPVRGERLSTCCVDIRQLAAAGNDRMLRSSLRPHDRARRRAHADQKGRPAAQLAVSSR